MVDPYTAVEVAALVSSADTVYNGLLVAVGAFLDLRRGELLGLMWKGFDPDKQTLLVKRQVVRERKELRIKHLKTVYSRRVLRRIDVRQDRSRSTTP